MPKGIERSKVNTMTNSNNVDKIALEVVALNKQIKALELQKSVLTDKIKTMSDETGMEVIKGSKYYFTYQEIISHVVDNDKLKQDNIYNLYLKTKSTMRLSPPTLIKE